MEVQSDRRMVLSVRSRLRGILSLRILIIACLVVLSCEGVWATTEFTCQTGQSCSVCHEDPEGGSTLTPKGQGFLEAGYSWDEEAMPSAWRHLVRLVVGFFHVVAAVMWFGAIFYVHLFIRPSSLTRGLPRRERVLGWVCIIVVAGTGTVLTLLRVHSLETFWTTTFGIVWLVKVGLFLVMLGIAAVTTTILHRRMVKAYEEAGKDPLALADGKEGRPAHIVFQGQLYDVSRSTLWTKGVHMGRHSAGADLTGAMADAPHGDEVLDRVNKLGKAVGRQRQGLPRASRIFVILSYVVLGCMLAILLCVAYWSWGPALVSTVGG